MNNGRMIGKRVLVTGSDTGLGRETALQFAREGADVVLHYPQSEESALKTVSEIQEMGRRATALPANFNHISEVLRLGEQAVAFLGGLDVLINNAGVTMNRPIEKVTPEQWDCLFDINVRAPYFLIQATLHALLEGGGAIINLASVHAFEAITEHAVYAGTKGAIVAMTRGLAIELAPRGVRVNAIAPGATVVENYYKVMPNYDPEQAGRDIPIGFVGHPLDIARTAVFLASEEARYIVGQTIIVDGGTTSWMPFNEGFRQPLSFQFGKGYVPGVD
ncbi:dehydrogenase [Armatimonadota bacterium]|nr:dehydrogenase [Armatimonadota bacterium]